MDPQEAAHGQGPSLRFDGPLASLRGVEPRGWLSLPRSRAFPGFTCPSPWERCSGDPVVSWRWYHPVSCIETADQVEEDRLKHPLLAPVTGGTESANPFFLAASAPDGCAGDESRNETIRAAA